MCVGNIWAVCARRPTKHADFTLGFLRFPDSFEDRLRQPGMRCRVVYIAAGAWQGAGDARASGAAAGAWFTLQPAVRLSERCENG